jgi:hypothetical protein
MYLAFAGVFGNNNIEVLNSKVMAPIELSIGDSTDLYVLVVATSIFNGNVLMVSK